MSEDDEEEIVLPMKAEDIMVEDVVKLDEETSVKKAAEIMVEEGITAIIITKKKKIVGIVTERDILKRVVVREKNVAETKMKDIMSNPLITIEPNTKLEEAARLMFEKRIKNLPVMKNNRLIGLVSLQDICKFQPKLLRVLKGLMETPENLDRTLKCYII
ncbi:MAG: cyclic nucleotide-binding/CBS domain-containing protein [Chloroflexota bacterium]